MKTWLAGLAITGTMAVGMATAALAAAPFPMTNNHGEVITHPVSCGPVLTYSNSLSCVVPNIVMTRGTCDLASTFDSDTATGTFTNLTDHPWDVEAEVKFMDENKVRLYEGKQYIQHLMPGETARWTVHGVLAARCVAYIMVYQPTW
jgi:hypothetical protein